MLYDDAIVHTVPVPFGGDGGVDFTTFDVVLDRLVTNGARAIIFPTYESEVFSLTSKERMQLIEVAGRRLKQQLFIANVSASSTAHAVDLARQAESSGAAGLVVAPPYYWRVSWDSVVSHFRAICDSVAKPVFALNDPNYQKGLNIPMDVLKRVPFSGVLDYSFNYEYIANLKRLAKRIGRDFRIVGGAEFILPYSMMGIQAWVSPVAGLAPSLVENLAIASAKGHVSAASDLQQVVTNLRVALRRGHPAHLKAGMGLLNRPVGAPREPLRALSDTQVQVLAKQMEEAGLDISS